MSRLSLGFRSEMINQFIKILTELKKEERSLKWYQFSKRYKIRKDIRSASDLIIRYLKT